MNIPASFGLGFPRHHANWAMRAKKVQEEEDPYVRNLLERLLSKVFDQRSAQRFPIVLPEVNDMVSPGRLCHIECGLTINLLVPEAAEKRKPTLRSGKRKELKYQNTNSSNISRLFKESVTFVCFFLGFLLARTAFTCFSSSLLVGAGSNHLHFEILISCRT